MKIYSKNLIEKLPSAIIFDTDNTLYKYVPAHKEAINAVRLKVCSTFSISPEKFDDSYSQARLEIKNQLGATASSHSRLLYFQRLLEVLGLGSQVLWALDLEQTYWRVFLTNAQLFEYLKEFLEEIRVLKIPIAIITDLTAQIQFRKVVYFGLDHYINYIVTSEEAGQDKPSLKPFEIAINKLQVKDNIWFIGDDPECDIEGAKNSINAVTFHKINTKSDENYSVMPDVSFTNYKELLIFLKTLV